MRIIFQLFILTGIFAGTYFGLSRIDFVGRGNLVALGKENAEKLGDLMLKTVLSGRQEIKDSRALSIIDSLKVPLCTAGGLNPDSIQVHLINDSEINAFTLPGNHIILHNSLFSFAEDPGEVAGVLGHELGHLKLGHLEKKLLKEVGLTLLFTIAGGEGGQEILKELVHQISSTSFDREYENEADAFAVEVLAKSGISPEKLSNFMFRIAGKKDIPDQLVFLSTHPESQERAAEIIRLSKNYPLTEKPIIHTSWEKVQEIMD